MRVHSGNENPSQTGIICAMEGEEFFLFLLTQVRQKQVLMYEFSLHKVFYRPQQFLITF